MSRVFSMITILAQLCAGLLAADCKSRPDLCIAEEETSFLQVNSVEVKAAPSPPFELNTEPQIEVEEKQNAVRAADRHLANQKYAAHEYKIGAKQADLDADKAGEGVEESIEKQKEALAAKKFAADHAYNLALDWQHALRQKDVMQVRADTTQAAEDQHRLWARREANEERTAKKNKENALEARRQVEIVERTLVGESEAAGRAKFAHAVKKQAKEKVDALHAADKEYKTKMAEAKRAKKQSETSEIASIRQQYLASRKAAKAESATMKAMVNNINHMMDGGVNTWDAANPMR